jgi:Predicted transcriptional regulator
MKILQILADGRQIRLPAIASQIGKSERTVRRDLDSLRAAGKIEFIGSPRTGYYRLCPSTCDQ